MKLTAIFLFLISSPVAQAKPPLTEPGKIAESVCDGQIEYLKRSCTSANPGNRSAGVLKHSHFKGCYNNTDVEVIYENVASTSSSLGAHKACSIIETRDDLDGFKSQRKNVEGKPAQYKKTEFYRDFDSLSTKEIETEDADGKRLNVFSPKKPNMPFSESVECKFQFDHDKKPKNNCFKKDIAGEGRTPIEINIPSDEDLNKIRKGFDIKSVVETKKSSPVIPAAVKKATETSL